MTVKEKKLNKHGYERFIILIEGVQKEIRKLKLSTAPTLGIKGVHIFWLAHIGASECGMTAAEIAAASMVDRSLISREIEALKRNGYLEMRRGRRYVLTEEGRRIALEIEKKAKEIQGIVNDGIAEEELDVFYKTLERLSDNFKTISAKTAQIENDLGE